jgi:hypothetical protein
METARMDGFLLDVCAFVGYIFTSIGSYDGHPYPG